MKRFMKRIFPLIIAAVFTVSMPLETRAMDMQFYSANDILLYDEDATTCTAGDVALSGKDNREKIFNFLKSKGLNDQQAVGVVGNIKHESGYSPTRHEESHSNFENGGYGIAQWTFGRRTTLKAHLEKSVSNLMKTYYNDNYGGATTEADGFVPKNSGNGELMPLADNDAFLSAELQFLFEETSSRKITASTAAVSTAQAGDNEWEALKKAKDVADATKIWLYNFEIPANIAQAAVDRAAAAEKLLNELKSSSGSVSGATGGCVDATSGDVTALQATIKKYAWPTYHPPGYIKKMPDYDKAIKKAAASGGYVGGSGGVDCGAFVTRVIVDSGWDPEYNSKKGATAIQAKWLEDNWESLGKGPDIDPATLQPGDVAILPGHTFMFAGTNIEGFGKGSPGWKGVASASLGERSPMAGNEKITGYTTTWYRKKAVSHE